MSKMDFVIFICVTIEFSLFLCANEPVCIKRSDNFLTYGVADLNNVCFQFTINQDYKIISLPKEGNLNKWGKYICTFFNFQNDTIIRIYSKHINNTKHNEKHFLLQVPYNLRKIPIKDDFGRVIAWNISQDHKELIYAISQGNSLFLARVTSSLPLCSKRGNSLWSIHLLFNSVVFYYNILIGGKNQAAGYAAWLRGIKKASIFFDKNALEKGRDLYEKLLITQKNIDFQKTDEIYKDIIFAAKNDIVDAIFFLARNFYNDGKGKKSDILCATYLLIGLLREEHDMQAALLLMNIAVNNNLAPLLRRQIDDVLAATEEKADFKLKKISGNAAIVSKICDQ